MRTLVTSLILGGSLYGHWPLFMDLEFPDSVLAKNPLGYVRLGVIRDFVDSNGIQKNTTAHFTCDSASRLAVEGYYMVEDSLFDAHFKKEGRQCQIDTLTGFIDFLQPGPVVQGIDKDTILQFGNVDISVSANAMQGRPIRSFLWEQDDGRPIDPGITLTPLNADSSRINISIRKLGEFHLRVSAIDSYGKSYDKLVTITVLEQPEVQNQFHFTTSFNSGAAPCRPVDILFATDTKGPDEKKQLHVGCNVADTLYFGRPDFGQEVIISSPGYYSQSGRLGDLCGVEFFGFDKNPARNITCNLNFTPGPVADAGPDITLPPKTLAFLNSSNSSSLPGRPFVHKEWWCDDSRSTGKCPAISFIDPLRDSLPFIPVDTGVIHWSLVVYDSLGFSAPDEVIIKVTDDIAPVRFHQPHNKAFPRASDIYIKDRVLTIDALSATGPFQLDVFSLDGVKLISRKGTAGRLNFFQTGFLPRGRHIVRVDGAGFQLSVSRD